MFTLIMLIWYHVQHEIKYYQGRNRAQLQAIGIQTFET